MIVDVSGKLRISIFVDNKLMEIYKSKDWYVWMRTLRNKSLSTATMYLRSVEKFYLWGMYNPIQEHEPFPYYVAKYRQALLSGFTIKQTQEDGLELTIAQSGKLSKTTINKEMAGIKSYYEFIGESSIYKSSKIDTAYESRMSRMGLLAGINIKKSKTYLEAFGKRVDFVKAFKTQRSGVKSIKALPLNLFDKLLTVAKPRERLLYLICGACSARIGQALNLTLNDIDYKNSEVWLLDPTSERLDIFGNKRKIWLFEKYGIDISTHPTHSKKDYRFKYPIPLRNEPLFWFNESKYKKLFFDTLIEYTESKSYVREHLRPAPHPFLFITESGNRLTQNSILCTFKANLRKIEPDPVRLKELLQLGSHSLRHMFGTAMAELFSRTGDDQIISICKDAMGHSTIESTMIYFNFLPETKRRLLAKASEEIMNGK